MNNLQGKVVYSNGKIKKLTNKYPDKKIEKTYTKFLDYILKKL